MWNKFTVKIYSCNEALKFSGDRWLFWSFEMQPQFRKSVNTVIEIKCPKNLSFWDYSHSRTWRIWQRFSTSFTEALPMSSMYGLTKSRPRHNTSRMRRWKLVPYCTYQTSCKKIQIFQKVSILQSSEYNLGVTTLAENKTRNTKGFLQFKNIWTQMKQIRNH